MLSQENKEMISSRQRELWEKQHYRIVGTHSAVKTCSWTRKMLQNEGGCYKLKFYGIQSHRCMQMTTSMSCGNRCTFCWRDEKAPVSKEWKWAIDDPDTILEQSLESHHQLLTGINGSRKINKTAYEQSKQVKHVALSLTGEPITYPRINELINDFHEQGISTFIVTNAQYPEQIKNLNPVTQLYISLDAPSKSLLKEIDLPLFKDYWQRLNKSLDYMSQKKERTCIRLTILKGINDIDYENYSSLIEKANPDFIEVKAYMFLGASRQRLKEENMPFHEDIIFFSKELNKFLPDYDIVSEHIPSRVVLLAKREFKINNKWHTWIDFPKFIKLALSEKAFTTEDYLKLTPTKTGLSGKDTLTTITEN